MYDAFLCINSVWRSEKELEADETSNFLLLRLLNMQMMNCRLCRYGGQFSCLIK